MALNLRTLLRCGLSLALAMSFVAFGTVDKAKASQVLQYVERGYGSNVRPLSVTDNGSSTFFTNQSIAITATLAGIPGTVNGFITYLGVNANPNFQSSGSAVGFSILGKTNYFQDFLGAIKITSGINGTGTNYLTAVFTDVNNAAGFQGVKGQTTASLQISSTDRTILTLTSDVLIIDNNGNEDASIALNNIHNPPGSNNLTNKGVQLHGNTIQGFAANETGTFSADLLTGVPEPASFIGAALAGCLMVGLRLRRGRVSAI